MRTSLEASIARQKRENARVAGETEIRVAEARRFIDTIPGALLRLDPDLRRIVLFGSLASGDVRRTEFDIDLAVDSDRYLRIVTQPGLEGRCRRPAGRRRAVCR